MLENLPHPVGEALSGLRAGRRKTLVHQPSFAECPSVISVSSPDVEDGAPLDRRFTADGEGLSPALRWSGSPAGAVATVIAVEDADSPTPIPILHLIAWAQGADGEAQQGAWGPALSDERTGHNSFHKRGWLPPDPPPGHGAHRYLFQVFAVDALPDFSDHTVHKGDIVSALKGHVLGVGSMTATYQRP